MFLVVGFARESPPGSRYSPPNGSAPRTKRSEGQRCQRNPSVPDFYRSHQCSQHDQHARSVRESLPLFFYNLFFLLPACSGETAGLPLVFLVFSAVLNVILDLVFIINFKMGVAGAASATILSQGISAILCLVYILHKKCLPLRRTDTTGSFIARRAATSWLWESPWLFSLPSPLPEPW